MPQHKKRDGKYLEKLGNYDPSQKVYSLNKERYDFWLANGAQPSERLKHLVSGELKGYTLKESI